MNQMFFGHGLATILAGRVFLGGTQTLPTTAFLALHSDVPGATGVNEIVGAGRLALAGKVELVSGSDNALHNKVDLVFDPTAGIYTARYIGIWDSIGTMSTALSFLLWAPLDNAVTVPAGESLTFAAGDLVFALPTGAV